ncbi:MAG: sensor histidine kinase [Streptosporangiales bacterium]
MTCPAGCLALGHDELARLGGTLNEMLGSLEESVHRERRLVADAAHELRTPLAGLTTALEVARTHPQTGQTLASDLPAGHRRLGRLVNDLLILAAVDGRAARRAEPVDLAGLVTDCSRRLVPDGLRLRLGDLDRVFVNGDETHLSRVAGNLIDNALRYAASTVELSVRQDGPQAVISVSDDGPGIPPADRQRIWDRFTRLDDDRSRASGGSGLGLAIVRELTTAHGGSVSVASRHPGPGTIFLVRLPVTPGRTPVPAAPHPTGRDVPPHSPEAALVWHGPQCEPRAGPGAQLPWPGRRAAEGTRPWLSRPSTPRRGRSSRPTTR